MTWTNEEKLRAALRMPWTVRREDSPDDGIILHVEEIPDAFGVGDTDRDAERSYWEALEASLRVRIEHGDAIPLPPRVKYLPWEAPAPTVRVHDGGVVVGKTLDPDAERTSTAAAGAGWASDVAA